MKRKHVFLVTLCAAMTFSAIGCGTSDGKNPQNATLQEDANQQIASPFISCETLHEASTIAGFDMTTPESLEGYDTKTIEAIEQDMIQVIFSHDDTEVRFRKALGDEDISGDYNDYSEINTCQIGNRSVTVKGNENRIMVAIWTENGYTYAIDSSGIDMDTMTNLIQQLS